MKIIAALGNPGKKYAGTRHNVGWLFLDWLCPKAKWQTSARAQAKYLKTELNGQRVEIIKPQTFMNNSGMTVAYAAQKNGVKLENIIVIHDDKDIPLGETRVQKNRGAGGHNGVASVIEKLDSKDFTRIRIGINPTDGRAIADTANFVLNKLTKEEQRRLKIVFENVKQDLEAWISLTNR